MKSIFTYKPLDPFPGTYEVFSQGVSDDSESIGNVSKIGQLWAATIPGTSFYSVQRTKKAASLALLLYHKGENEDQMIRIIRVLKGAKERIEDDRQTLESVFGSPRSIGEIAGSGDMPQIYYDIIKLLDELKN